MKPLPMMSDAEVNIVEGIIMAGDDLMCLEWGCGGSTCHFSWMDQIFSWLSVEHNGHWVQKVVPYVSPVVSVVWAPEDQWYIDCVKHSGKFDFILVDGLHRRECIREGLQMLTDDGVMLLHDAGREEYQDFIKEFGGEMLIEGEEPYNGYYKHRGLARFTK